MEEQIKKLAPSLTDEKQIKDLAQYLSFREGIINKLETEKLELSEQVKHHRKLFLQTRDTLVNRAAPNTKRFKFIHHLLTQIVDAGFGYAQQK